MRGIIPLGITFPTIKQPHDAANKTDAKQRASLNTIHKPLRVLLVYDINF